MSSFAIQPESSLAESLKNNALKEVEQAIQVLSDYKNNPNAAIHTARVTFKKIRTIIRLVRYELGRERYKQENRLFREAGLMLANARDSFVKQQTLRRIAISADVLLEVECYLPKSDYDLEQSEKVQQVVTWLEKAYDSVDEWTFQGQSHNQVTRSSRELYKHGKKRLQKAIDSYDDEDFHEWRKAAKHLYYFIKLMTPINPDMLMPYDRELSLLSEYIGNDHDLAILKKDLKKSTESGRVMEKLLVQIEIEQTELKTNAVILGRKIYAEKPDEFINRIESYRNDIQIRL